jgi:PAS domain S-box-containing protein
MISNNNSFEADIEHTAENSIRDTQLRLAVLIGNLNNVVLYETGGGREFVTQNIFNLLGYPPEKFTQDRKFFATLIHPDDSKAMDGLIENWYSKGANETLKLEFRCRKADGNYIWLEDYLDYINPPGNKPYMTGVLIDITERKKNEDTIKKSLREKEILLREIHHRVNNNLQVISSLLKIQSHNTEDEANKEIFNETLNRIRSMAVIHQLTCKSSNLARIDLNLYFNELSKFLREGYQNKEVQFSITSYGNITLNIDAAVPCGLLINELVSLIVNNSERDSVSETITCYVNNNSDNNEIVLSVEGSSAFTGIKEPISKQSLGLQLINTLVEQIDGKLEPDFSESMKFTVTFKDNQYPERLA